MIIIILVTIEELLQVPGSLFKCVIKEVCDGGIMPASGERLNLVYINIY